jgi:sulfur-carrier protein adenylyltransferase/sulfurtransferase
VIKVISGIGETLSGRLFLLDAATFETRTLRVARASSNPLTGTHPTQTGLIDYDQFCSVSSHEDAVQLQAITPLELASWRNLKVDFQLIDVREEHEYAIANLGGELIPLATVAANADRIALDKKVVVHCKGGKRSAEAIQLLEKQFGFRNLYNLKGGILAFADQVDASLAKY